MKFQFSDGGKCAFKGSRDCVVRAISIVAEMPYVDVYNDLVRAGCPRPDKGVSKRISRSYLKSLGFTWTPTMFIGKGCKVHLKADELPKGRLVVSVSRHLCAVIDGVIYDTFNPSRDGTRCVYGYYSKMLEHQTKTLGA